ncbi:MAG TPA: hypothetical protein VFD88_04830, partial [Clostridia bacterium]|nr:hypothetical protein [Clostridia bacterium]
MPYELTRWALLDRVSASRNPEVTRRLALLVVSNLLDLIPKARPIGQNQWRNQYFSNSTLCMYEVRLGAENLIDGRARRTNMSVEITG